MKHTAKRRAFARRPFPIRITSLLREVADRHIQQRRSHDTITAPYLSNPAAHWAAVSFYPSCWRGGMRTTCPG